MNLARSLFWAYWVAIMLLFGGGSAYVGEAFIQAYIPEDMLAGAHAPLSLNTWLHIAVFVVFCLVSCVGAFFVFVAPLIVLFPRATKRLPWEGSRELERKWLKKLYEALGDET